MVDMFQDITSANIGSYWMTLVQSEAPYLGEVLFPNTQVANDTVSFYRGLSRAPKPLALSAFDAQAIPRDRQGFEKITTNTRFFKESKYIDEKLRQELIRVQSSPIAAQRDLVLNKIFNDSAELLRGAALSREIMRMQLLQTGKINMASNGQIIAEDYEMKKSHVATATKGWGEDGSTPLDDIRRAQDTVATEEGITLTRAVMNQTTFRRLLADPEVKATLLANNGNTAAAAIPRSVLLAFLQDEFGLNIQVYDKGYVDTKGAFHHFIEDGNVVFMPAEALGTTSFAPTPEQVDLMASAAADVTVVDTGVAITSSVKTDPVTKETKVTQNVIPTFEMIDGVYVLKSFSSTTANTHVSGGDHDGGKTPDSESTSKTEKPVSSESQADSEAASTSASTSNPPEA